MSSGERIVILALCAALDEQQLRRTFAALDLLHRLTHAEGHAGDEVCDAYVLLNNAQAFGAALREFGKSAL